ncbi:MAG: ABC transporter substrate-binding protein [Chloroflexi bacterium]|nr:ABC transporter substrate-binding protein [Chloroflexota bacterium]
MSKLRLTMACSDYDLTHAFVDRTVEVEGVDLNTMVIVPHERHQRVLNGEFEVAEWSIAMYLTGKPLGLEYTAIPVFPLRVFRHGYLFVRADSDIRDPRDLAGKRIGVTAYVNSQALWARAILQHEYGVDLSGVTWVSEGDEHPDWRPRVPLSIERYGTGKVVEQALLAGDVDVLMYPKVPNSFDEQPSPVRRLIPDHSAAEKAYFQKTGLFPIMHAILVRNDVLEQAPWVALSLMKAWEAAKRACYRRHRQSIGYSSLAWFESYWKEQQRVLGPDPFPYSFEGNRRTMETLIQYAYEQYLLAEPHPVESYFVPSTISARLPAAVSFYGY